MKKLVCVMVLGLALSLTACRSDADDEIVDVETSENEVVEQVTNEPETEVTEEPEETNTENLEEAVDPVISFASDWSAKMLLGYFPASDSLDDVTCARIIGCAYYFGGLDVETVPYDDEGNYCCVPAEDVTSYAMQVFGHSLDLSSMETEEEIEDCMVVRDDENNLIVRLGDWGISAPVYEITDVSVAQNDNLLVTVQYSMYDYELDEISYEIGTITYELLPTDDSEYGYFIIDFILGASGDMGSAAEADADQVVYESELGYSIVLPGDWNGNVAVTNNGDSDNYISLACEEENYTGILFTIIKMEGTEADIVFPSYDIIAIDGNTMYIALYPTDVQFDASMQEFYEAEEALIPQALDSFTILD